MQAHRRIIEKKYNGLMKVIGTTTEIDYGETIEIDKILYEEEPCYLQQLRTATVVGDGVKSNISYDLKILCAPNLEIPSGCTIKVCQDGMDYELTFSGEPFKYLTHQEIRIKRDDIA